MESELLIRLSTLSHPQRMGIFRLLQRRYPDAVPAGEIATALGLKPSTASVYLSALLRAGLIVQSRSGTSLRYRLDLSGAQATVRALFVDCCGGRPDLCPPALPHSACGSKKPCNVLFICTGNSARSIFAEAILRDIASDRFRVFSAGTEPKSAVNPIALEVLHRKGHNTAALCAKPLSTFQTEDADAMDFVFTVCDQAANEECPPWPGQPISAHWGLPDPARVSGTGTERRQAFQRTFDAMHNRIARFAALPFATLDRLSLQNQVDEIGRHSEIP